MENIELNEIIEKFPETKKHLEKLEEVSKEFPNSFLSYLQSRDKIGEVYQNYANALTNFFSSARLNVSYKKISNLKEMKEYNHIEDLYTHLITLKNNDEINPPIKIVVLYPTVVVCKGKIYEENSMKEFSSSNFKGIIKYVLTKLQE